MKQINVKLLLLLAALLCLNTSCEKKEDDEIPTNPLEGSWIATDYWLVQIYGDCAYLLKLGDKQQTEDLKAGDLIIRNLVQTGESTWTGEEMMYWVDSDSFIWIPVTYMLSITGNELISHSANFGDVTYYRIVSDIDNISTGKSTRNIAK